MKCSRKLGIINEDEPALIDGGWIESWDVLNEYNQSGKKM